jgi:hypothetical protein
MKWTLEYVCNLEVWKFNQVKDELHKYHKRQNAEIPDVEQ